MQQFIIFIISIISIMFLFIIITTTLILKFIHNKADEFAPVYELLEHLDKNDL